jgi:hypothetical protein
MMTVRQIERQWSARAYLSLFATLNAARPESDFAKATRVTPPAAAALAIIRLDELALARAPIYADLVRALLRDQAGPGQVGAGGWGDPAITALCLRALLCGNGQGDSISRGLHYLAELQKPEGIWPGLPNRRMPLDPLVSAYVLYELADRPEFRAAVRFPDAVNWFTGKHAALDPAAYRIWQFAQRRCHAPLPGDRDIKQPLLPAFTTRTGAATARN